MSDFIDSVMERPLSHRIGFWVVSLIFFGFVFWQYLYSPKHEKLTELNDRIDELETQITHEKRLARNLGKVREEVRELDIQLNKAMQELPDKRQIPDLLASISDLASDAGLEVSLFKPKPESFREFYADVPVSVSVAGTFHQVATFFDEVGRLDRIVNINQIAMREPKIDEDSVQLEVDCLTTTFRYLDESERITQAKKNKGNKRRR